MEHWRIYSLEHEIKIITNKKDIANSFNEFFVDIGTKLQDSNAGLEANNSFQDYLKTPNNSTIFLKPIINNEIITVDNMKNNTSSGIDDIDIKVVKYVIPVICKPVSIVFN